MGQNNRPLQTRTTPMEDYIVDGNQHPPKKKPPTRVNNRRGNNLQPLNRFCAIPIYPIFKGTYIHKENRIIFNRQLFQTALNVLAITIKENINQTFIACKFNSIMPKLSLIF